MHGSVIRRALVELYIPYLVRSIVEVFLNGKNPAATCLPCLWGLKLNSIFAISSDSKAKLPALSSTEKSGSTSLNIAHKSDNVVGFIWKYL